jgi:hypothetical protein
MNKRLVVCALAYLVPTFALGFVEKALAVGAPTIFTRTLRYGAFGALLSWSFTTLAVAAKNIMNSVPDYLLIETAFTLTQWCIVAPLTVLLLRRGISPGVPISAG